MSVTQDYKLSSLRRDIEKVNRGSNQRGLCRLIHGNHVVTQSGKFGGKIANEVLRAPSSIVSSSDTSNDFAASTLHVVNKNRVSYVHAYSCGENGSVAANMFAAVAGSALIAAPFVVFFLRGAL